MVEIRECSWLEVFDDFHGIQKPKITNIFVIIRDIRDFRKSTFIRDIRDIRAHESVGNPALSTKMGQKWPF